MFVVLPEENPNTYFMVSLLIQQLYREILTVADEKGGALDNRVMFYCDEFGSLPPISSAEVIMSHRMPPTKALKMNLFRYLGFT